MGIENGTNTPEGAEDWKAPSEVLNSDQGQEVRTPQEREDQRKEIGDFLKTFDNLVKGGVLTEADQPSFVGEYKFWDPNSGTNLSEHMNQEKERIVELLKGQQG